MRALKITFVCLCLLLGISTSAVAAVPNLISYQGWLTGSDGNPLDSTVDITFYIYTMPGGGTEIWSETHSAVEVIDGQLSVQLGTYVTLDETVLDGNGRFLGVQVGDGPVGTPLAPIVSVAYAYRAEHADTADYARAAPTTGGHWTRTGSLLYTNGDFGIARGGAYNQMFGSNAHTFVNLGRYSEAGANGYDRSGITISGGYENVATGDFGVIGGGRQDTAMALYSFVGGGFGNRAGGYYSDTAAAVAGGIGNAATARFAFVGGGYHNEILGAYSTIAGGKDNRSADNYTFVGGGQDNRANGTGSSILGGYHHRIDGSYSSIIGGYSDTITSTAYHSTLIGIGSKLTADSTFMVDMPHIRFGNELTGYEFPAQDGTAGQILVSNGAGQLNWSLVSNTNGWTDNGPHVILDNVGDWVGVGASSPEDRLHVAGNIRLEGSGAFLRFVDAGTLRWSWLYRSWANATFSLYDETGARTVMAFEEGNGHVGIGTVNPEATLHIVGDAIVDGNLSVTGSSPFPSPAYNSGWQAISQGANLVLTHDLGGSVDNYVVDMQFKDSDPPSDIHNSGYGGWYYSLSPDALRGAEWWQLSNTSITVHRKSDDSRCDQVRVRIWMHN